MGPAQVGQGFQASRSYEPLWNNMGHYEAAALQAENVQSLQLIGLVLCTLPIQTDHLVEGPQVEQVETPGLVGHDQGVLQLHNDPLEEATSQAVGTDPPLLEAGVVWLHWIVEVQLMLAVTQQQLSETMKLDYLPALDSKCY